MALSYGFPARKLVVIGVTGTKGKSIDRRDALQRCSTRSGPQNSTCISTIRFAIEERVRRQSLQDDAPRARLYRKRLCAELYARAVRMSLLEVTSESVLQYRNRFLDLDGLIVTNIQREHIESHGS